MATVTSGRGDLHGAVLVTEGIGVLDGDAGCDIHLHHHTLGAKRHEEGPGLAGSSVKVLSSSANGVLPCSVAQARVNRNGPSAAVWP